MRSYLMSLTLVACVLGGYTAVVVTSKAQRPVQSEAPKPHASAEAEPREPANDVKAVN